MRTPLVFCCLLLGVTASNRVQAQDYIYATGNPAFSTQIPIESGFINVNNGEIHIEIPLAAHTQRGHIPLKESLVYDSRVWQISASGGYSWQPTNVPNSMGGWRLVTNNSVQAPTYNSEYNQYGSCGQGQQQYPTNEIFWNFAWTDPQGTNHLFDVAVDQSLSIPCQPPYQNSVSNGNALDGSGYSMTATYDPNSGGVDIVIWDVNGNQIYPTVQDSNGNYFSSDSNGNLIDTLGRTPVLTTSSGNQIYYNVLGWNGVRNQYTVTTETVNYHTAFNLTLQGYHINDESGSFTAIQSIQLPDGSSYSFTYDTGTSSGHYGELTGVTLPSGGGIQYTWQNYTDSFENENRWIASRVTSSGTTTFQPQTISYCSGNSGCQEKTIVTDPAGNDTVYTFSLDAGTNVNANSWNSLVAAYQGPYSSGTQLENIATNYTYNTVYMYDTPSGTETYLVPQTQTVQANLPAVALTAQTVTNLNSIGASPTSIQHWDYYSGSAPPSPTIQTNYTYMNGTSLPTEIQVTDGTGNQVSATTYSYDQTALTPTSGLPNHVSVSNFGNLTTMSQWINTSNTYLTVTATYDDAGTLLTKTDPNGKTTYGYDNTDTFATSVTPPTPSSGVVLASSDTFDYSSGLLSSATDPNAAQTVYKNYDFFGRVGEIDYPDGGKTTFAYTSTQSSEHQYQNSSTYADSETLYDSYGRAVRTAIANGQTSNPWYVRDTCYNSVGEAGFTSYSYQAASLTGAEVCSGAGDTFTYDAMGRVTNVTHGDGTQASSSYTGRATEATDEYGIGRVTQTDALGRIAAVCEIAPNSLPNSQTPPASCGLDIAATGFLTTYTYNLQGHQTTVAQGSQTRVFQTDSIGRPILQQEPESGQTTYGYAYNSTGLQISRVRPQANQSNSSVTTTTTTQYDTVGRTLSITYGDGTPTRNYTYDQANMFGGGVSAGSSKGRLSWATTSAAGNWAGTAYQYDAMGRVTATDQCLPSGCGNAAYDKWSNYSYDWLGNVLTASDGAGVTASYSYSPANEVLSTTSSLNNSTHPPNLVSNVMNGPFGPLSWQLGNGLCGAQQYDAMGRITGGGVYSGSVPPNCSSGAQLYAFTSGWTGSYLTSASDSALGQNNSYGYDELGRLHSLTVNSGNAGSFLYWFDRWGNRVYQQVTSGSGPQPTYSFSNNQITNGGFGYDAAGNELSDGVNTYSYDAEGNVTQEVQSWGTTTFNYDALNQQVRTNYSSSASEVVFGLNGQLASLWWAGGSQIMGKAYWDGMPLESYLTSSNQAFYQHFDWNLNKRLTTTYAGVVYGQQGELPFGDGLSVTGHRDNTFDDFGGLWDNGSTMHADDREYSDMEGRWMQSDPYGGSYDFTNPQSFNRYAYVVNQPLSLIDPTGQEGEGAVACAGGPIACIAGTLGSWLLDYWILNEIFGHHPLEIHPSPSITGSPEWDGNFGERLGISTKIPLGDWGIAVALGLPTLADIDCLPFCDETDPDEQRIRDLAVGITADSQHSFGCIAQAYGVGAPGETMRYMGQPVPGTKPFVGEASVGTSPISDFLSDFGWKLPKGIRFPAPTGGPFTGKKFAFKYSRNFGRQLGRWAPIAGWVADIYATAKLWACL